MTELVNAFIDDELDLAWVERLMTRTALPVRHAATSDDASIAALHTALVALAQDARPVFEAADTAEAARVLNDVLSRSSVHVSVSISDQYAPHLHFDAHGHALGERLRVNGLVALATVLADQSGAMRLGLCASSTCEHVFVDHGRSARQRFCSRRCATRSHVSEHRQRRSAGLA